MSLIEMIYLEEKRRIIAGLPGNIANITQSPNSVLAVHPVNARVALAMHEVPRVLCPDPWDRIIVATARMLNLPLVNKDERIRASGLVECIW